MSAISAQIPIVGNRLAIDDVYPNFSDRRCTQNLGYILTSRLGT